MDPLTPPGPTENKEITRGLHNPLQPIQKYADLRRWYTENVTYLPQNTSLATVQKVWEGLYEKMRFSTKPVNPNKRDLENRQVAISGAYDYLSGHFGSVLTGQVMDAAGFSVENWGTKDSKAYDREWGYIYSFDEKGDPCATPIGNYREIPSKQPEK